MRNRWLRILTVSAACGLSAVAFGETPGTGANKIAQTTENFRASDWQRVSTPAQASDMFKGEKHSLTTGIQAAERAVGGHAVRAECRMKTDPTMGANAQTGNITDRDNATGGGAGTGGQGRADRAGAKATEIVCAVTCLVGDSKFVEVFVDSRGQVIHRDDQGSVGAASLGADADRNRERSGMRDRETGREGDWNPSRNNNGNSNGSSFSNDSDNGNHNYNGSRLSANFGALGLVSAQQNANHNMNGSMTDETGGMRRDHSVTRSDNTGATRANQFAAPTRWHKSADLVGKPVTNNANENLGRIEDIVIDANSGRILYGVVSFGGFLGMGEKWFAVPWESLNLQGNSEKLVLNVDKESLKNAQGFDKSQWPDFADQQWATNTYKTYNAQPYWNGDNRVTAASTTDGMRTSTGYRSRWNQPPVKWTKVSDLKSVDVLNNQNQKVGDLVNTAVDPDGGRVLYAVVDLTDGDLVAIPWQSLDVRCDANDKNDKKIMVNMTQEQLKNTGTFTNANWPNLSDRAWGTQTYQRYEVQPYWEEGR